MEYSNENVSFERMWENAADEYWRSTNKRPIYPAPTIDRVVAEIHSREAENEKSNERTEKVKAVMTRVEALGDLAAQGASIVS